jgi:hypothetical protein
MPIREEVEPPNLRKGWIQTGFIFIAGMFVLWLASGDAIPRMRAAVTPPKAATAALAPSSPPAPFCSGQQLELGLFFTGCAESVGNGTDLCGASKPGVFQGLALLRDPRHAYLLYLEVDGGYHGPDIYPLVVWPHASLGTGDGVAKVALREAITGALWRSTAGWLRIDAGEKTGSVRAGLVYDGAETTVLGLKAIGRWSCG